MNPDRSRSRHRPARFATLLLLPLALGGCAGLLPFSPQWDLVEMVGEGRHNEAIAFYEQHWPERGPKMAQQYYCYALHAVRSYRKFDACAGDLLERMGLGAALASNQASSVATLVGGLLIPGIDEARMDYLGAAFNLFQRRADMSLALGDLDAAERYAVAQRSLPWGGIGPPAPGSYFVSGMVHARRGERAEAIEYARKLETVKLRLLGIDMSADWFKMSNAWWASDIYLALGMKDEAKRVVDQQLKGSIAASVMQLNNAADTAAWHVILRVRRSHLAFATDDWDTARDGYDELLGDPMLDHWAEYKYIVLYDRARIALVDGDVERAIDLFQRTVEMIESARSTLDSEAGRIGFVGDKQDVYANLISALVAQGRHAEAFEYAERGKARALIDLLASKPPAPEGKGSELEQALADLRRAEEESAILDFDAIGRGASSGGALPDSQRSAGAMGLRTDAYSPEVASLVSVVAVSTDEIRSRLRRDEAIVEYYHHGDELLAFVVTRDRIDALPLDGAGLAEEVANLRGQIMRRTSNAYRGPARALHDRLVAPLRGKLRKRHWIVVPHGPLHYLPFAALHDGERHLVERVTIRVLPSASVLQFVSSRRSSPGGSVLALGNPSLGDASLALPSAESEARAITKGRRDARLLLRDQATETAVKEFGGKFRYLHLATHGEFDEEEPLASRLLLGADDRNDGSLTVGEIYDLDLDADLVTLSACETGMGLVASGDDVVGLTRGFLYAGTRAVLASLWPVSDQATERLMRDFYGGLEGSNARDSLRSAQLRLREQGLPHPYYWAAFQLTGAAVGAPLAAASAPGSH